MLVFNNGVGVDYVYDDGGNKIFRLICCCCRSIIFKSIPRDTTVFSVDHLKAIGQSEYEKYKREILRSAVNTGALQL